jgi:hypothetical protein
MFIGTLILGLLLAVAARPSSVSAGPRDFDNDGYTDLAIGVPYENVSSTTDAGRRCECHLWLRFGTHRLR